MGRMGKFKNLQKQFYRYTREDWNWITEIIVEQFNKGMSIDQIARRSPALTRGEVIGQLRRAGFIIPREQENSRIVRYITEHQRNIMLTVNKERLRTWQVRDLLGLKDSATVCEAIGLGLISAVKAAPPPGHKAEYVYEVTNLNGYTSAQQLLTDIKIATKQQKETKREKRMNKRAARKQENVSVATLAVVPEVKKPLSLSIADVSKQLGVSKTTVIAMIKANQIEAEKSKDYKGAGKAPFVITDLKGFIDRESVRQSKEGRSNVPTKEQRIALDALADFENNVPMETIRERYDLSNATSLFALHPGVDRRLSQKKRDAIRHQQKLAALATQEVVAGEVIEVRDPKTDATEYYESKILLEPIPATIVELHQNLNKMKVMKDKAANPVDVVDETLAKCDAGGSIAPLPEAYVVNDNVIHPAVLEELRQSRAAMNKVVVAAVIAIAIALIAQVAHAVGVI